jgi:hypothetical protein
MKGKETKQRGTARRAKRPTTTQLPEEKGHRKRKEWAEAAKNAKASNGVITAR